MAARYLFGITCTFVICYTVVILPVAFPTIPFRVWLSRQSSTGSVMMTSSSRIESSTGGDMEESKPTKASRPRSALELKFSIQGPHVQWNDVTSTEDDADDTTATAIITLDYQMSDWVTLDVLQYKFYDFDCVNVMDESELDWKAKIPEKLDNLDETSSAINDDDNDDDDDSTQSPFGHVWRLTLYYLDKELSAAAASSKDNHHSSSFCVRWMLFNMPMGSSNEHAMEVTFRQTQLIVDRRDGQLVNVQVSSPEPVGIQVHVNGQGRATTIHRNDDVMREEEL